MPEVLEAAQRPVLYFELEGLCRLPARELAWAESEEIVETFAACRKADCG